PHPLRWDVGAVVLGESGGSVAFPVGNVGTAAAAPLDVALAGARATAFVIDPQSSCDGAALAPGASCTIHVIFRPDVTGAITATLDVGGLAATLVAEGIAPGQLVLAPTGADLGSRVVRAAGAPAQFTRQNRGGAATAPLAVPLRGARAGQP